MVEAMNTAVVQMSKSVPKEEVGQGGYEKEPSKEQGTIMNRGAPVPSGLSALLSAVTLQLDDSKNDKLRSCNGIKSSSSSTSMPSNLQKPDLCSQGKSRNSEKSTPTMVPEVAKKMPVPESLMTLLMDENNANILTFLPGGKYFAFRTKEFSEGLLKEYFAMDTLQSFLKELHESGFTHIETDQQGIEVFCHSLFKKGDWEGCEALVAKLEQRTKDQSLSPTSKVHDDSESSNDHRANRRDSFKRRLSPAHAQRVGGSHILSQQARLRRDSSGRGSLEDNNANSPTDPVRLLRDVSDKDYHQAARIIASEKIVQNGQGLSPMAAKKPVPLVQQAVENATRTIVTDAIESLLRDEHHTKEIFHRHERALSQSSIPGIVPISKQLFANELD
jgi:sugar phosphate isomerase/epimerase